MESLRGCQSSSVIFIHYPRHPVDFNLVDCRECLELPVTSQENAASVFFGEREC
jgi:hypothetical protein